MTRKPSLPDPGELDRQVAAERNSSQSGLNSMSSRPRGVLSQRQPQRGTSPYIPIVAGPGFRPTADQAQRLVNQGQTPAPVWVPSNVAKGRTFYGGGYFTGPAGREYAIELEAWAKTIHSQSTGNSLWEDAVTQSAWLASDLGLTVTPYDLIQQWAEQGGGVRDLFRGGGGGGFRGGGGFGGGSSTQMTIDLSSPAQARGLIMQAMQGILGRDPSEDEYSQFVTVLNEAQTANPQVVSVEGDTVTRSGGLDAGLLALDYAQSREDYEDVQANQYYNMFLDVLSGG